MTGNTLFFPSLVEIKRKSFHVLVIFSKHTGMMSGKLHSATENMDLMMLQAEIFFIFYYTEEVL